VLISLQPANSSSGSRRSSSQCRTMAFDIVKLYISLISQTFVLSDMVVMTSATAAANYTPPPLLPTNSHSLSTAYHLSKLLAEVQECVTEINTLEISAEVSTGLKSMMESLKWRFEEVLTHNWLRGIYRLDILMTQANCLCQSRREDLSSPRSLGSKPGGPFRHFLSSPLRTLPTAHDYRCI